MGFIKKIKIKNKRLVKFNNMNFLYYEYNENNKIQKIKFFPKEKNNKDRRVYYLKVNIIQDYTFISLQHWIDIIHEENGQLYIICDNKNLEAQILKKIKFYDLDVNFIKSSKDRTMRNLIKKMSCTSWKKAAYAHMTTIYHASKHNIKKFWNIDADDTMLLLSPKRGQELLKKAEIYSLKNDVNIFSLDMHVTKCGGNNKFWTLGVAFLQYDGDLFDVCRKVKNTEWLKYFDFLKEGEGSADAFLNYIGHNTKGLKIGTFYNNNLYFIHWKYLRTLMFYAWKNGHLIFPFLKGFGVDNISQFKISSELTNLNLEIKDDEWKDTMKEKVLEMEKVESYIKYTRSL